MLLVYIGPTSYCASESSCLVACGRLELIFSLTKAVKAGDGGSIGVFVSAEHPDRSRYLEGLQCSSNEAPITGKTCAK